ncbi:hypothetical protein [Nocardia blacklockiae]|uniref:hypothetical protein n=1 Tax=Nocardia blacklockiae TaxID=480036 RepID=UPI0018953EE0|nr:hypothetical protein [Nocardia blacklockiae]MBF6173425.1 hypothetical protein [Nocardia blacklockiae]
MTPAVWIALYGGILSTFLAVLQFASWSRARPKLSVGLSFLYESNDDSKGTPVRVRRGEDIFDDHVLLKFTIRNSGSQGIQVVAIVIEDTNTFVSISEIVSNPLATVVEPMTSIEVTVQKEFLDMCTSPTFIGIVDGLGRRHSVPRSQAEEVIKKSWSMPTRAQQYRRRDNPEAPPVWAFQSQDSARMASRPVVTSRFHTKARPITSRNEGELESMPPALILTPSLNEDTNDDKTDDTQVSKAP